MASNLRRSKRTFGQRYLRTEQKASASSRNPAPRRIGARVITTNNIAPRSVTTVVLANDVVQDIEYAQATADGKNTIYYSATEPSGGTYTEGDLWFETDNDNALSRWDGAAWQSFGLGNAAFSNIDAGKITSGTISTAILFAGELTAARGTFGGFISAGNVQIGDGIYSNANYRGLTLNSSDTNNAWYVDTSTGNVYFKVGSATQYMEWTGSVLNVVGNISGSTVTGSTISTSTFSAGNPTGDGVSITGTQVTINTTGGTSSARLKFNTNAGSGDNFVDSDKRLVLRAGGGSANADKTIINIGRADGSNRDIVNVEATDLQLNGTSVLTSGSLPSGTIWTSDNDGSTSGLDADLLDGNHASAFADSGHNHSGVYSPTTHNHSGTYLPLSGGTLTGSLTVPGGSSGLYVNGWIFANGDRILFSGGTGYVSRNGGSGWTFRIDNGGLYVDNTTDLRSTTFIRGTVYLGGVINNGTAYADLRINTANDRVYWISSLREHKTDIHSIYEILEYIDEINPIYNLQPVIYKDLTEDRDQSTKTYQYGFIAEEVVDVLPELSLYDKNGKLVVYNEKAMVPLLTAEVQRLGKMVTEMYKQLNPEWSPPKERSASSNENNVLDVETYRQYVIEQTQIREAAEAAAEAEQEADIDG